MFTSGMGFAKMKPMVYAETERDQRKQGVRSMSDLQIPEKNIPLIFATDSTVSIIFFVVDFFLFVYLSAPCVCFFASMGVFFNVSCLICCG